jgi:hypothetical protein
MKAKAPWGTLFAEEPPLQRIDSQSAEFKEKFERELEGRQFALMLKLKRHYGIQGIVGWRPWYELALQIACELDGRLRIVDPVPEKRGKTSPRWRGSEGFQLLKEVEAMRGANPRLSVRQCLKKIMELAPRRYPRMTLDALVIRYNDAKIHHTTK